MIKDWNIIRLLLMIGVSTITITTITNTTTGRMPNNQSGQCDMVRSGTMIRRHRRRHHLISGNDNDDNDGITVTMMIPLDIDLFLSLGVDV
jgi:hypothetical protein